MKIAIVGSGISGLTCLHYLSKQHEVSLYEANDYIGGHTHTHDLMIDAKHLLVDTGFIVFNKKTYPLFVQLLEELQVEYYATSMSFSVSCEKTGLEYNGTNFNKLFSQRSNLLRPSFYGFLKGIAEFNKITKEFLLDCNNLITLRTFFKQFHIKQRVIEHYVIPMIAAVWSTDPQKVWDLPATFVLRFFENHGFLEIDDRPQWYVIKNGSRSYIEKMLKRFSGNIHLSTPVLEVLRNEDHVLIKTNKGLQEFDNIIFACHGDTALSILNQPSSDEHQILSSFPYSKNQIFLHTDESFLPKRKRAWASWNYVLPANPKIEELGATVTYNMNILQDLKTEKIVNVTLNPHRPIDHKTILKIMNYAHPLFTVEGIEAQKNWNLISGKNKTFYCGAYWRNGFHEDGVFSALRVIEQIRGI